MFSAPKQNGGYIAIKMIPTAYEKCLKLCSHSLIDRVFLSKGEEPWKLPALRENLQFIWKLSSPWRLISLERFLSHFLAFRGREILCSGN